MRVDKIDSTTWGVESSRGTGDYTVTSRIEDADESTDLEWSCDCKAFEFGGGKHCKHITAVQEQLE